MLFTHIYTYEREGRRYARVTGRSNGTRIAAPAVPIGDRMTPADWYACFALAENWRDEKLARRSNLYKEVTK